MGVNISFLQILMQKSSTGEGEACEKNAAGGKAEDFLRRANNRLDRKSPRVCICSRSITFVCELFSVIF